MPNHKLPYIDGQYLVMPPTPEDIASVPPGFTLTGMYFRKPGISTKELPDGTLQICGNAWTDADLQHIRREYAAGRDVIRG
ncbi:MAG: hypothetical protein J0I19_16705 [Alphaproteobacteria bacterium]|nr:hypothetical protein [Alphaproteobacteria bacterium]